jgi:hypothetical protein
MMQGRELHEENITGLRWCGVITFVQSWRVTNHIRPVLGWPDGYNMTTTIATTRSNQAVGILTGYGHMKSHPSTLWFYPVMSYGSPVMSHNMAWAGWLQEKFHQIPLKVPMVLIETTTMVHGDLKKNPAHGHACWLDKLTIQSQHCAHLYQPFFSHFHALFFLTGCMTCYIWQWSERTNLFFSNIRKCWKRKKAWGTIYILEEIFQIVKELSKYATWQWLSNNKVGKKIGALHIFFKKHSPRGHSVFWGV